MSSDLRFLTQTEFPSYEPNEVIAVANATYSNYSHSPSEALAGILTETLVRDGGIAKAMAEAGFSFQNNTGFSNLFTESESSGMSLDGPFGGSASSEATVIASFEVSDQQPFSFDFFVDLEIRAKEIENPDTEYNRANSGISFWVLETSNINAPEILGHFDIWGNLISSQQIGERKLEKSDVSVTISNDEEITDIDGNNGTDFLISQVQGSYQLQKEFEIDTNITIVQINESVVEFAGDSLIGNLEDGVIYGTIYQDKLTGTGKNDKIYASLGNDNVAGNNGDDIIEGGFGDDLLNGGHGNDMLNGGRGNDTISGDNGDDTITGLQGNDIIEGGRGGDIISGGSGNDILAADRVDRFDDFDGTISELSGDDGNDTIYGGSKGDTINGGNNDDVLLGIGGNDTINGGSGNDLLNGGIGNDLLDGEQGTDTADYSDLVFNGVFGTVAGVDVNLAANQAQHSSTNNALTWNDTLISIENVIGTSRNDRFIGNANDNVFDGQGAVNRNDRRTTFRDLDGDNYQVIADVVEYSGNRSDFTFTGSADNFTVTAAGIGVDTLINIEFIKFNDGLVAVNNLFT
jgi:serralysin